ncbi:MAG: hypothetical protein IKZ49_03055 [Alphaproteobacteria bacterium]|nr:hypothetical protein [Alphaproteobacteria bacterium]
MSFFKNIYNSITKKKFNTKPVLDKEPDHLNFVEQYTFIDPRNVLIDYDSFSLCETTPVACETQENKSAFCQSFQIPTHIASEFINILKTKPKEQIQPKKMRTMSIIHTTKGRTIVVMPEFLPESKFKAVIWDATENENLKKIKWLLDTDLSINQAVINASKIYTK